MGPVDLQHALPGWRHPPASCRTVPLESISHSLLVISISRDSTAKTDCFQHVAQIVSLSFKVMPPFRPYSSDRSFSHSHYDPLRPTVKHAPALSLPSIVIDPELERSPRVLHPDSAITPAESRDRGRRVEPPSQINSRGDRQSDTGFRRRTGEHRVRVFFKF
jgi:hypothetical protein